jgi:Protein of unknown function (DUF3102)
MTEVVTRTDLLTADEWTPQEAATYVTEPWQNAVESIVETGRRLIEAKQRIGHGLWLDAVALMPFSEGAARKLMLIAKHPDLSNRSHVNALPASWGTLYALSQLPEGEIPRRIEAGEITPELERRQAEDMASIYQVAHQESLNRWNSAFDGLTAALAYAKDFTPPTHLPDNYGSITEFKTRYNALGRIIKGWEAE